MATGSCTFVPSNPIREVPQPHISTTLTFPPTLHSITPSVAQPCPTTASIRQESSANGTPELFPAGSKLLEHSTTKDEKKEVIGEPPLHDAGVEGSIDKGPLHGEVVVLSDGVAEVTLPPAFRSIETSESAPTDTNDVTGKNQQSTPMVDTMMLFGVQSDYLGINFQRETRPNGDKKRKGGEVYSCQVDALSSDGTLDMYSYHRGREGYELRDQHNGALHCPCLRTDTNHTYDAPRTELKIVIEFPLCENDKDSNGDPTGPVFSETFDWDLSDPKMPSPAGFANQIATEFGLSYGQMLDLTMSIESQIGSHMHQHWNYCAPVSVMDPLGNDRRHAGPNLHKPRIDEILRMTDQGNLIKTKTKDKHHRTSASGVVPNAKKKRVDEPKTDEIEPHHGSGMNGKKPSVLGDSQPASASRGPSDPTRVSSKPKAHPSGVRIDIRSHLMVTKPPLSEFPREIVGNVELDRATATDYLTVFTSSGSYLTEKFPEVWTDDLSNTGDIPEPAADRVDVPDAVEDGNVDYCHICHKHGNLVCCDYCPRAFHMECIESSHCPTSDSRWECMVCLREKQGLEDDLVDAAESVDTIADAFAKNEIQVDLEMNGIKALSAIRSMILKLLDYDFGQMFAEPVDEAIPDYRAVVKEPMDLGTICKKLANGDYAKALAISSMEEIETLLETPLIALLNDIELVWHNCLLYNFDGSAIHRMASVQRRRAMSIRMKSFDHLLSDKVKNAVEEYAQLCESARIEVGAKHAGQGTPIDAIEKELRAVKPKGKYKIISKSAKPKINKPVAVLDSHTGRIVKTYSSMKSAYHAALSMVEHGHQCEQAPSYEQMKLNMHRSETDSSVRMFGYRWIFLEALRAGTVAFHTMPSNAFQVHHEGHTFTYASIDEASSFPHSRAVKSAGRLLKEISKLRDGCGWTLIMGSKWRRLNLWSSHAMDDEIQDLQPVPSPEPRRNEDVEKEIFASCSIVKKDTITGKTLAGYSTPEAAFLDWSYQAWKSPLFPPPEERSMENFTFRFLDGDRNIDGLVWQSQQATRVDPVVRLAREITKTALISNGIPTSPLIASAKRLKRPKSAILYTDDDGISEEDTKRQPQRQDEEPHVRPVISDVVSPIRPIISDVVDSITHSPLNNQQGTPITLEIQETRPNDNGTPMLGIQLFPIPHPSHTLPDVKGTEQTSLDS